jgi:hypothetical protein
MRRIDGGTVEVAIGYGASAGGSGVVYAALGIDSDREVMRLPFRIERISAAIGRAVPYAALVVATRALFRRGIRRARFVLPDREFVDEVTTRCEVPDALMLPYVRLRCALNTLDGFEIANGATDELMQRARAEVALNLAA